MVSLVRTHALANVVYRSFKRSILGLVVSLVVGMVLFLTCYSPEWDPTYNAGLIDAFFGTLELEIGEPVFNYPTIGEDTPNALVMRIMYALYPLLGTVIIAFGLIEVGIQLFRTDLDKEVAKLFEKHTIVVGIGHVGTRVCEQIETLTPDVPVVAIDLTRPPEEFLEQRNPSRFAFLLGDGSSQSLLTQAGVRKADRLLLVTDSDTTNLKIAIRAKKLNPQIRTILRTWDQEFASKVRQLPDVDATISSSEISAPLFVASSYLSGIRYGFRTEEEEGARTLFLATLKVGKSDLEVGEVEKAFPLTILSINKQFHPKEVERLKQGDNLLVLGELDTVKAVREYLAKES